MKMSWKDRLLPGRRRPMSCDEVGRWLQHHPGMEPVLAATGQPVTEVAAERLGEKAEAAA